MIPDHDEKEPWENICMELRAAEGDWSKVPCKCAGLRLAYEAGYEDAVNDMLHDGFPVAS